MQQREKFMREALKQAVKAKELDEVPVGAVVVRNGEVIARAYNTKNKNKNAVPRLSL